MERATINPTIMNWAMERASLTQSDLANRLGLKEDYVKKLREGTEFPTFFQAQNLARKLRIPVGYLFLSSPPETISPIADFRTLPRSKSGHFSPELEDTINDARRKQDWLRDWRTQEGKSPLTFVGEFSIENNPKAVAKDIRQTLELPLLPRKEIKSWEDELRFLVKQAEAQGILVLQNGVALENNNRPLSLEEFRGFSLADQIAPIIFINSKDWVTGRIFTLVHELAHLWSGTSGVSNSTFTLKKDKQEIEHFCDQVSAEVLVPHEVFLQKWQMPLSEELFVRTQRLAKIFRVSVFVIIIRAKNLNLINNNIFQELYNYAASQIEPKPKSRGGAGNFYNSIQARNGRPFLNDLMVALRQGNIMYRDAAQLLNVHPATIEGIIQRF